jgi:hypothetical protein
MWASDRHAEIPRRLLALSHAKGIYPLITSKTRSGVEANALRRRTLIEEPLEDATRYPDRAFVGAENHSEKPKRAYSNLIHGITEMKVRIPA